MTIIYYDEKDDYILKELCNSEYSIEHCSKIGDLEKDLTSDSLLIINNSAISDDLLALIKIKQPFHAVFLIDASDNELILKIMQNTEDFCYIIKDSGNTFMNILIGKINYFIKKKGNLLKNILSSINFPYIVLEVDSGKIVYTNMNLNRNPEGEVCHKFLLNKDHPCYEDNELCPIKCYKENNYQKIKTEKFIDGIYYEVYAFPLINENKILEILIDVSERIQYEKRIKINEEKYQNIIDKVKNYIYRVEYNDGTVVSAYHSPMREIVTGYSQEDYNKNADLWADMIHPEDKEKVLNYFNNLPKNNNIKTIEHRIICKDGSIKWVSNTSNVEFNSEGKKISETGYIIDITEKKEMEEKNLKTLDVLEQLSFAVEQSPNSIVITDINGTIEYVNAKFTQITGYSKQEAIGNNPRILKSGDQTTDYYNNLWDSLKEGKEWRGEFHNKKKNGEYYWELASISPIRNTNGEITHYIAIKEDISERKEFEKELVEAKIIAENATQAKSDFLANMSHEIRTPMNAIIGMTNLLIDTKLTAEQKEYANTIYNSADVLLSLINDILDLSKIESGKLTLEKIDFNLIDAVESSIDLVALSAAKKGIEIISYIDAKIPSFIKGDPVRIRQILINLINNAVKFTNDGEIEVNATLVEENENSFLIEFNVRDTGIGIKEEDLPKLFQSFMQVDSSTTRKFGGTGLGLSICKQLVRLMGGELSVESDYGYGSTFSFYIKADKPTGIFKLECSANSFKDMKFLIFDDNDSFNKSIKKYIEEWGGNLLIVNNKEKCLELTDFSQFQAMIIKYDLLKDKNLINSITIHKIDVKKILLTSTSFYTNEDFAKDELRILGQNQIQKPVKKSALFKALQKIIASDLTTKEYTTETENNGEHFDADILIVEDNETNYKLLQIILNKLGAHTVVAKNGLEALEFVKERRFDIILMDIQMPVMNGYDATIQIRAVGINTPIVAVSANVFKDDIDRAISAGMNSYLTKPYKKDEIINVLNQFVKKSPKRRTAITTDASVFNYEETLSNYMNEKEVVVDVLKNFVDKVEKQTIKIKTLILQNDFKAIQFEAHSIKGAAYNILANKLGDVARDIEAAAKNENLEDIKSYQPILSNEFQNLKEYIKNLNII
ncbi:MAG: PAS domain S-box protein [Spirochaetes bacterium]|nr:PAS domain S-box protein [Spirochaetota bacterium]